MSARRESKQRLAYLPLFVRDFLTDPLVLQMRWIDQAIYLRMLMASWEAGPLPDDDEMIVRLIGAQGLASEIAALVGAQDSFAVHDAVRGVLETAWELGPSGWTNPRLEREREHGLALASKRATSGSNGGRARWARDDELERQNQRTRSSRLADARGKGRHTTDEWAALVGALGGLCVRCGGDGELVRDHILPIYQGGSDAIDNLQPLCRRCNASKGPESTDHRPRDWAQRLAKRLANACAAPGERLPSQAQAQDQDQDLNHDPHEPLASLGAGEPASPAPGPPKIRRVAQGPHPEAIRAWDELCVEFRGEPWAWGGKDAAAIALALKKAGSLDKFIERARRLWEQPPDEWYAQNLSPSTLNSKWNELAVRVVRQPKKTRDQINLETLAKTAQELFSEG